MGDSVGNGARGVTMKINGCKIPSPVIRLVKHLIFTGKGYSEIVEIVSKKMNIELSEIDIMEIEDKKGAE